MLGYLRKTRLSFKITIKVGFHNNRWSCPHRKQFESCVVQFYGCCQNTCTRVKSIYANLFCYPPPPRYGLFTPTVNVTVNVKTATLTGKRVCNPFSLHQWPSKRSKAPPINLMLHLACLVASIGTFSCNNVSSGVERTRVNFHASRSPEDSHFQVTS